MSTIALILVLATVMALTLDRAFRRTSSVPPHGGGLLAGARRTVAQQSSHVRLWMSVAVSLILLAASLLVILSDNYDAATEKWAFSTAGAIAGYWYGQK